MKILYKDNFKIKHLIEIFASVILLAVVFIAPYFLSRGVIDTYSRYVFPWVALPFNMINGCFAFSLTENVVIIGSITLLALLIVFFVTLFRKILFKGGTMRFALKITAKVLVLSVVLSIIFQLMFGLNYRRTPVKELMKFNNSDYSITAYYQALGWAYSNMLDARNKLGEDYKGVAHMSMSVEEANMYANQLLTNFSNAYDLGMTENFVRAKPVSLSKYWSLTHIVGVYDPFVGEANVNTGYVDITSFCMNLCHELSHAKGFAGETDCNIIAALACTKSSRPEFRYAGFYYIFWDLYEVVYNNAVYNGGELPEYLASSALYPVYRDMAASDMYWDKIDSMFFSDEISEVSNDVNDAFIRFNGGDGVESYKVPQDIYLDYYMTYVTEA